MTPPNPPSENEPAQPNAQEVEEDDVVDSRDAEPSAQIPLPTDLYALFKQEASERQAAYKEYVSSAHYETHLRQAFNTFQDQATFAPGDMVQWKTFLRGAEYPDYGNPAIVVEVFETPMAEDREGKRLLVPHDVVIGFLDGEQDFEVVSTSSRRLVSWVDGTAS